MWLSVIVGFMNRCRGVSVRHGRGKSCWIASLLADCAISPWICFVLTPALVSLECEVGVLAVAVPIVSTAWNLGLEVFDDSRAK